MLIDDVTIEAKAGKGGDGVVRFERTMMMQGPTGGNGGRGGNVILRGVSDLGALRPFRTRKTVKAAHGGNGGQNTRDGAGGKDCVVLVPVGTWAHDTTNDHIYDITHVDQEVTIARGGNGGFGNAHFKSSRNTTPQRANNGKPGESVTLHLALKMIADVGFVGLPNVGKSSLLNTLTNAASKVANYQFTTLEPHLGVYYDLILADIPGLIEGAADGKGLGHKFLRHIERTRVLLHFIAADSPHPIEDYHVVRKELKAFNPELLTKPEWIVVSRADERTEEEVAEIVAELTEENTQIVACSLLADDGTKAVEKVLTEIARTTKQQ